MIRGESRITEGRATAGRLRLRRRAAAFTLVELLVVVAIITILSTMLLGASSLAMESARQSRTEALIAKLHVLLSQHYDSFRHRRVELSPSKASTASLYMGMYEETPINSRKPMRESLAKFRLWGTWEQLRMEMPDRWSDITLSSIPSNPAPISAPLDPEYLRERPVISRLYLRQYNRIVSNASVTGEQLLQNQGAECLYMVIMMAAGDGESASLFKESEVADTDGDGAPEFIDAWGNPIQFLRWPAGFDSDAQTDIPELLALETDDERVARVAEDPDPTDLFRVGRYDPTDSMSSSTTRGFRVAPLIYSAGADAELGLQDGSEWNDSDSITTRTEIFTSDKQVDFVIVSDPFLHNGGQYLGQVVDRDVATDNVHNHLIEGR